MKLQQISIFLENKPGHLKMACDLLAKENINILTLSLADTKRFGILRLIVQDWENAKRILEEAGFVVRSTEVLAIEMNDHPGGLVEILTPIEAAGLNIEYMYAFTFGRGDKAVLIFRFDDPDTAIKKLKSAGINVVGSVELYSRTGG